MKMHLLHLYSKILLNGQLLLGANQSYKMHFIVTTALTLWISSQLSSLAGGMCVISYIQGNFTVVYLQYYVVGLVFSAVLHIQPSL